MFKRYVVLLLAIILVCTPLVVRAEGLSMDEIVEMALRRNIEVQVIRIELDAVDSNIQMITGWIEVAPPASLSQYIPIFGPQLSKLYERREPLLESLEIKELRVTFDVKDATYGLLTLKAQQNVQAALVESLRLRLDIEKKRLEKGLVSELAVKALDLRVAEAVLAQERASSMVDVASMRLNHLLNFSLADSIEIDAKLEFNPVDISLEESLKKALSPTYGELKKMTSSYDKALNEHNQSVGWGYAAEYPPALRIAALHLKQFERLVELSVRTKVNDIIHAEQAVYIAQQALVLEQRKLEVEEKRLIAGLTTQLGVVEQANLVASKELDLLQKIYQYNKAVLTLELAELGL